MNIQFNDFKESLGEEIFNLVSKQSDLAIVQYSHIPKIEFTFGELSFNKWSEKIRQMDQIFGSSRTDEALEFVFEDILLPNLNNETEQHLVLMLNSEVFLFFFYILVDLNHILVDFMNFVLQIYVP